LVELDVREVSGGTSQEINTAEKSYVLKLRFKEMTYGDLRISKGMALKICAAT